MKKYLPHLIAVAAFLILTVAFFAPLFGGKELKQQDINNWKGMSNEIVTYHEKSGESTLWTNSMFGGMPAYQISVVYGANLLQYVDKVVTLGLPAPASYLFLFMVGFYFLLLTLKVDTLPQVKFWRYIMNLHQDSALLNIGNSRCILQKTCTKTWDLKNDSAKSCFKDSVRIAKQLDSTQKILLTTGKKFFYDFNKTSQNS